MKSFRSNAITNNNIVDNLKNILFILITTNKNILITYLLKSLIFIMQKLGKKKEKKVDM